MCGIAGFCNFKEDFEENTDYWNFRLEKMRAVLAHRGNDARGRFLKKAYWSVTQPSGHP